VFGLRITPGGPCFSAPVLLDRLVLADDRRPHRLVDDLLLFLYLRGAIRTDVDVRRLRFRGSFLARDLGAPL